MSRPSWIEKRIEDLMGGPDRFRQVKESIRSDRGGALPFPLYGRGDILTRPTWLRIIKRYNPGHLMETSDKIEQKLWLHQAGVPVPATYMIVSDENGVRGLGHWLKTWEGGFAVKPNKGHGGNGILVVDRRSGSVFIKSNGRTIEIGDVLDHARRIIEGEFSGGPLDRAIVEERIVLSPRLRELLTEGLLDIRIVVFKGFPIMAMTRIPTRRSEGKANIHQGALAAGISISEGRIVAATYERRTVRKHPTTGRDLIGFRFNEWDHILETASKAAMAMELGYVGVDLTVDGSRGVLVIEVNRKPGLEIQNANGAGLLRRIRFVERRMRKEIGREPDLGPGIRSELARSWDRTEWGRIRPEDLEE